MKIFTSNCKRERERKRLVSKFCACRIFSLYETFCSGVVVEDCLFLLTTLLKNNSSNQNFFRESSYIQRLTPYFDLDSQHTHSQAGWSAQKVSNLHLMLQVGTEMSHEVSEFWFFLIQAFFSIDQQFYQSYSFWTNVHGLAGPKLITTFD